MSGHDLVVRGGLVVTPDGTAIRDIAVRGGRIAEIGRGLDGARVVEATGRVVLPGGVDAHCHIDQLTSTGARTADDFRVASIAAAFGGTTTLMPFAVQHRGHSLRAAVEDYRERAGGKAVVDYAFHLIVTDPDAQTLGQDLPALAAAGFTSIKIYLTYDALRLDDRAALEVMAAARREGLLVMVHAESHDLIGWLSDRLLKSGHGDLRYFGRARPVLAERDATHHAISMAELVDIPILIVHVSSRDALDQIRWAQAHGLRIYGETCPQYLLLSESDLDRLDFEGAKYCCSPPLRDVAHQQALWEGLVDGALSVYSSDHSAFFFDDPEGKLRGGRDAPFNRVPYGLPGLETRMPLLFSEGVAKGRMSLERFAEVTAAAPARIYGLEAKGRIAVGADADLVVWDPERRVRIGTDVLHDGIDYTPYDGIEAVGWPVTTIVRGAFVVEDGEMCAEPGHGRLLACARPAAARPSGQPATGFDVVAMRFTRW